MAEYPSFSAAADVDVLADLLGEPTRRSILRYVAAADEPVTAAEVGTAFGVHRTVARGHLERLMKTGLLRAELRHRPGGGRPPKVYLWGEKRLQLQVPMRQYELLAGLLVETLERFGDAAELMARDMGRRFGAWLGQRPEATLSPRDGVTRSPNGSLPGDELVRMVLLRLAPILEGGDKIEAVWSNGELQLHKHGCLFREVAAQRPRIVCSLDQAVIEGLVTDSDIPLVLLEVKRRSDSDDSCRFVFQPKEARLVCHLPTTT